MHKDRMDQNEDNDDIKITLTLITVTFFIFTQLNSHSISCGDVMKMHSYVWLKKDKTWHKNLGCSTMQRWDLGVLLQSLHSVSHLHRHLLFLSADLSCVRFGYFCLSFHHCPFLYPITSHLQNGSESPPCTSPSSPFLPLYLSSAKKKKKSHCLVTGVNRECVKKQTLSWSLSVALQSNSTLHVMEECLYYLYEKVLVITSSWQCAVTLGSAAM